MSGAVTATDSNGNTASSTGSATWVNAGQGSLTLSNSWNAVAGIAFFKFGDTPEKQFEYGFVADASGSFAMSYTLTSTATPDFTGVFGFLMRMSDLTAGGSPLHGTGSTTSSKSGTLNFSLVSGHEYRFTVFDGSNFAGTSPGRSMTSTLELNWTAPIEDAVVASVPAPGGLALFGAGVVILARIRCRAAQGVSRF